MKVNSQTNFFIRIITIAYTILLIAALYLKIAGITLSSVELYAFDFFLYISYVLILIYLIVVLRTLKEHKTVIRVFLIYLVLEVIKIALSFLTLNAHYTLLLDTGAGTLSAIISMYLIIQTFNLQNHYIAVPYRLFGASLVPLIIAYFYITSSSPSTVSTNTRNYLDILKILVPLAILFILKNVNKYIEDQNTANAA